MLAVVKTPHTDLKIHGVIPDTVLKVLREEYGELLKVRTTGDDDYISVFDSSWYKKFKKRVGPGDYVKTYRENASLTQEALGRKIGKSRAYVCDVEKGRRPVSREIAKKFAKLFQVSTDCFL